MDQKSKSRKLFRCIWKDISIYNGNQIRMKYANSSVLLGEYSSSKKST